MDGLEACYVDMPEVLEAVVERKLMVLSRQQRRALTREAEKMGTRWLYRKLVWMQATGQIRSR